MGFSALVFAEESAVTQDSNPALNYESAFAAYKIYQEEKTAKWRDVNELVKGGGHTGHGMEGMAHDPAPAKAEQSTEVPMDQHPHDHHHMMH
jgi:long-subunit fatty acid transport protein